MEFLAAGEGLAAASAAGPMSGAAAVEVVSPDGTVRPGPLCHCMKRARRPVIARPNANTT